MRYCIAPMTLTMVATLMSAHAAAPVVKAPEASPAGVTSLSLMAAALPCADIERSIEFYTQGLGMRSTGRLEMSGVTEVPLLFPGGGATLMLVKADAAGDVGPTHDRRNRIILSVPNLAALEARLTSAGYRFRVPITENVKFHVAVAQLDDPDGNHLELVQRIK